MHLVDEIIQDRAETQQTHVSTKTPHTQIIPTSQIVFPTDTLTGTLFGDYEEAYAGRNETCPAFRFAELLSVLGSLFGRKLCLLEGTRPIFPNMFLCLVGPSGLSRKSESIYKARTLVDECQSETFKCVSALASAEGLVALVADYEDVRLACFIDELRWLFVKSSQKITEGLIPKLNEAFDGSSTLSLPTRHEPLEAIRPSINLLGALTETWLIESITLSMMGGGFMNRVAFFLHEQMPLKSASEIEGPDPTKMPKVKRLIDSIAHLPHVHKFKFDKEVKQDETAWYHEKMQPLLNEDDLTRDAIIRVELYVKKLALILAYLQNDTSDDEIHLPAWHTARAIGEYWTQVNLHIISKLSFDKLTEQETRVLKHLDELGGSSTKSELSKKIGRQHISARELMRILEALIQNEIIQVSETERGGGTLIKKINE